MRIAIIIGSTRPNRNGEAVGKWVYELANIRDDAVFELIDLKDFHLPLLDSIRSGIINLPVLLDMEEREQFGQSKT